MANRCYHGRKMADCDYCFEHDGKGEDEMSEPKIISVEKFEELLKERGPDIVKSGVWVSRIVGWYQQLQQENERLRELFQEQRRRLCRAAGVEEGKSYSWLESRLTAVENVCKAAKLIANYKGTRTHIGTMFDPLMDDLRDAILESEK